jgi:hypothetical protein
MKCFGYELQISRRRHACNFPLKTNVSHRSKYVDILTIYLRLIFHTPGSSNWLLAVIKLHAKKIFYSFHIMVHYTQRIAQKCCVFSEVFLTHMFQDVALNLLHSFLHPPCYYR